MHTVYVVGGGLVLLAVCAYLGKWLGGSYAAGLKPFLALWLLVALGNLYLGTTHGYSVVSELPFFLVVFGVPAATAYGVMRWL